MSPSTSVLPRMSAERITVGLTRRGSEELSRLAEETGMSKTDLVNRAIGLYTLMFDKTNAGAQLAFVEPNGPKGAATIEVVHVL